MKKLLVAVCLSPVLLFGQSLIYGFDAKEKFTLVSYPLSSYVYKSWTLSFDTSIGTRIDDGAVGGGFAALVKHNVWGPFSADFGITYLGFQSSPRRFGVAAGAEWKF